MNKVIVFALALVVAFLAVPLGPASADDVERRIAEFWRRVDALAPSDLLTATDLGQWALNVIERDPGAGLTVADFRASTAEMQDAFDRAGVGVPPGTPKSSDVESRIARFWQKVDALGPNNLLTAADLGQWALNVTDRDPNKRIRIDDFRGSTAGMQGGLERARTLPRPTAPTTPPPATVSPSPLIFKVSGTVRAQTSGQGVQGVQVIFTLQPYTTTYTPPRTTKTSADGTYSMDLPPGSYRVEFVPDRRSGLFYAVYGVRDPFAFQPYLGQPPTPISAGGEPKLLVVNSHLAGIDAVLSPGYQIRGAITDAATGQPVTDWGNATFRWIYAKRQSDGGGGYGTWSISTGDGPPYGQGRYSVWVPAGTFELVAWSLSKYDRVRKTVTVSNADVGGVDFALPLRASASPTASTLLRPSPTK